MTVGELKAFLDEHKDDVEIRVAHPRRDPVSSYLLLDGFRNPYSKARLLMSATGYPTRGTRVRLIHCNDPYTKIQPGTLGTVTSVDSVGTIHVAWDTGATLGMCLDDGDAFTVVEAAPAPIITPEEHVDLYKDTSSGKTYQRDGRKWVEAAPAPIITPTRDASDDVIPETGRARWADEASS